MKRKSRSLSEARTRLADNLSAAETYQSLSVDVNSIIPGMVEHFNLTRYEWSYLNGYADAIRASWQHTKLVYAVKHEGTLYKMDWDKLPEPVREYLRTRSSDEADTGHYWLNKDGTIGRPYFTRADALETQDA